MISIQKMVAPACPFKDVPIGEFFLWNQSIVLKTEAEYRDGSGYNAVAISTEGQFFTGEILSFEPEDPVIWLDAELKVFSHTPLQ